SRGRRAVPRRTARRRLTDGPRARRRYERGTSRLGPTPNRRPLASARIWLYAWARATPTDPERRQVPRPGGSRNEGVGGSSPPVGCGGVERPRQSRRFLLTGTR